MWKTPNIRFFTSASSLIDAVFISVIFSSFIEPFLLRHSKCRKFFLRHPCINGLRNVIRLSAKCGVTTFTIPLLLVEKTKEVGYCRITWLRISQEFSAFFEISKECFVIC